MVIKFQKMGDIRMIYSKNKLFLIIVGTIVYSVFLIVSQVNRKKTSTV